MLQKIWDWFNGNKTVIGTLILVLAEADGELFGIPIVEQFALWFGGLLAGTGFIHKIVKGTENT